MAEARKIQFAWFPPDTEGLSAADLYVGLVGEEPDSFQRNKAVSPQLHFLSRASGTLSNMEYLVQVQHGRVDFVVKAQESEEEAPTPLSLFNLSQHLHLLLDRIKDLPCNIIPEVTRLSIISNVIIPTDDMDSANKLLVELCNIPIDPNGATDLMFQINKRRAAEGNTSINRLIKYSSEKLTTMLLEIDKLTGESKPAKPIGDVTHSLSIMLDFNTVPTGDIYDRKLQISLLNFIAEQTTKFADNPNITNLENL